MTQLCKFRDNLWILLKEEQNEPYFARPFSHINSLYPQKSAIIRFMQVKLAYFFIKFIVNIINIYVSS
jgi:hypothetical protein